MSPCAYCGHDEPMHTPACLYDGVHGLDGRWRACTCPGFQTTQEVPC